MSEQEYQPLISEASKEKLIAVFTKHGLAESKLPRALELIEDINRINLKGLAAIREAELMPRPPHQHAWSLAKKLGTLVNPDQLKDARLRVKRFTDFMEGLHSERLVFDKDDVDSENPHHPAVMRLFDLSQLDISIKKEIRDGMLTVGFDDVMGRYIIIKEPLAAMPEDDLPPMHLTSVKMAKFRDTTGTPTGLAGNDVLDLSINGTPAELTNDGVSEGAVASQAPADVAAPAATNGGVAGVMDWDNFDPTTFGREAPPAPVPDVTAAPAGGDAASLSFHVGRDGVRLPLAADGIKPGEFYVTTAHPNTQAAPTHPYPAGDAGGMDPFATAEPAAFSPASPPPSPPAVVVKPQPEGIVAPRRMISPDSMRELLKFVEANGGLETSESLLRELHAIETGIKRDPTNFRMEMAAFVDRAEMKANGSGGQVGDEGTRVLGLVDKDLRAYEAQSSQSMVG